MATEKLEDNNSEILDALLDIFYNYLQYCHEIKPTEEEFDILFALIDEIKAIDPNYSELCRNVYLLQGVRI